MVVFAEWVDVCGSVGRMRAQCVWGAEAVGSWTDW